jgi:hypothetical protein
MFSSRIQSTSVLDSEHLVEMQKIGENLLKNKAYEQSEAHFKQMLIEFPDSEHAKVYLAYAMVDQHKTGWAELIADLQVSAFDPYVKALVNNLIVRVGRKILTHLDLQPVD